MTTEQKNVEICLMLGFTLSDEENDWSSNPFYCPPKWFDDIVNCDWNIESTDLTFDYSYDWQLTAIDWIEENMSCTFTIKDYSECSIKSSDLGKTNLSNRIIRTSRKEAIFESLFWLSQNYKNYL